MTLDEATTQLNDLPLPEVGEGDVIWYPGKVDNDEDKGYRFEYISGEWVHSPLEE